MSQQEPWSRDIVAQVVAAAIAGEKWADIGARIGRDPFQTQAAFSRASTAAERIARGEAIAARSPKRRRRRKNASSDSEKPALERIFFDHPAATKDRGLGRVEAVSFGGRSLTGISTENG